MITTLLICAPFRQVLIAENGSNLPSGFRIGAFVDSPGKRFVYVTRNRDGRTVLCPLTPAETLTKAETRAALHSALAARLEVAS